MGFENPFTFLVEKLKELWLAILQPFISLFNAVKIGFEEAINFPAEKLRILWLAILRMWDPLVNWLHIIKQKVEIGFLDAINFPAEKLRELWFTMVHAWDPFVRWLQKVFGPEIWLDRFKYLLKCFQKLALDDTWYPFLTWFDRVFPPETRAERLYHWFQVSLPFVVVAAVLALLCYCCTRWPNYIFGVAGRMKAACGWCLHNGLLGVKKIWFVCCGCGRNVKMMIAPGTGGMVRIPRSVFVADPKGYFLNLRGRP